MDVCGKMATNSGDTVVDIEEDGSGLFSAETVEESAEGSETYDDDHYYCEKCKSSFKIQCDVHGPPVFALDHTAPVGTPQRALLTLPTDLAVGWSRANKGFLGVFNLGQVVPLGMHFGPYHGEVVSEEEALKSVYSWVICKRRDCFVFVDATRDTHSNWMRFVACARNSREQNLVAYQQGGRLLFRCCAPIQPGQELLVWYAEDYATGLGITWDMLWDYKCSTNTDPGSSQVLNCPYCTFTFRERTYLQRHIKRLHTELYHNFLETNCSQFKEEELPMTHTSLFGSDVSPSPQTESDTCTSKQGSKSLIGQTCQSGTTAQQQSHETSESDCSQEHPPSASPSNEDGHICPQCGRSFARAYHLKRHEETVHAPDKMYCWGRGHRSQRKAPNPRRHQQSLEQEELEVEEREESDGKSMQTLPDRSVDVSSPQRLQEHTGQLEPPCEEVDGFVDPSDPLYEPPLCKNRASRPGLGISTQKRGRGRPRLTRPLTLAVPKRKRSLKIQRDHNEPRPSDQRQSDGPCGGLETVLTNGADTVVISVGTASQTPNDPSAETSTDLTCAECQSAFADQAALQSHECAQDAEGVYSCSECDLHFSQASNLRRHQRSVHALVKPYCCFPCGKFYTQASGLRRHQEGRQHKKYRGRGIGAKGNGNKNGSSTTAISPEAANIYSCSYCQFSFTASRYLLKHIKRHHPTEFVQALDGDGGGVMGIVEEGEDGIHNCPQCEKIFTSIKRFKAHRCFRHGERIFTCHLCGKGFSSVYGLQQHQRTHTGEKPYPCPHCAKSFAVSGQLGVHLRTHTGERPYLCAQCGESFRQSGDLKRHEQKHLGVRPHQCPQCDKSFSRPQSLRAHLQTHSGQRLFHCKQCNKAFTRGYHLTRHYHKMHSGGENSKALATLLLPHPPSSPPQEEPLRVQKSS